ncbi:MAG: SAM-dependent chlorinase/fluorinase [Actinobacteria bacterium]|nr:SAM-dependent chlorinase/fluorinase [Actinomycetota bacterium]
MGQRFDTLSFLSDLGVVDEHVGVVKAIVRDLAPQVQVVDLSHNIAVGDVRGGSLALARAVGYLPAGVVLAVVAAEERQAIAIEVAGGKGVLLGPDNGLLASAAAMAGGAERAVVLDRTEFHLASPGAVQSVRDVYAPIAARLCNGSDLTDLGRLVDADTLLPGVVPLPRPVADGGAAIHAEVLWVDHQGNCQLNIGLDDVSPWGLTEGTHLQVVVRDCTRSVERVARPSILGPGAVGLMLDGCGLLSLVLDHRSAAEELSLAASDQLIVQPLTEGSVGGGVTMPVNLRR